MVYREFEPPPALRPVVRCFWILRDLDGASHTTPQSGPPEGVLPDGSPEIILNFADPFMHFDRSGPEKGKAQPTAMLVGVITEPLLIAPSRRTDLLGVRLTPAGAYRLFGVPMRELTDRYRAIGDLSRPLAGLLEELGALPTDAARVACLTRRLSPLAGNTGHDPRAAAAVEMLRRTDGRLGIDRVAHEVGLGPRQFARIFTEEVGVGPKTLARIFRFQHVLRLVAGPDPMPAARAAFAAGYYDQSHLIRDFRQFAGASPGAFLALDHGLADVFTDAELARRNGA